MGVGGRRHAPAALPPGNYTVPIGCVGPRIGVDGAENLTPTGIRSLDREVHSESL